ncbi:MAG TPA: hypothetical protein DEP38_15340 [Cyanobacteria bacterium UBA9226]|nr:hypothetical protein [Cyanobacteria bacterium UBA9226]
MEKLIKCKDCEKDFVGLLLRGCFPLRCPTCADIAQKRPEIIQHRSLAYSEVVKIVSLPPGGFILNQATPKDFPSWKLSFKGESWGVNWEGRLDLYSSDSLMPVVGKNYLFEHIQSEYLVPHLGTIRKKQYIRLTQTNVETDKNLVWMVASTKTTLKGLGRQYSYKIVGNPLWEKRIQGGYRNLRAYKSGVLAVIDEEHQIFVEKIFDN